ncbi:MAG TPA: hypothetical protein VH025_03925 [Solirubrobacteraceae bacterium]|nr:hypothetical protein [Solirubrobacteraceae bacterium]
MASTQMVDASNETSHSSGVFIALVPWLLFTVIAQHGTLKLASIAALVIAAAVSIPGIRAGRPKALELGAVAAFAGFTVVALAADASAAEFVERYARGIAAALLALIAFGSLLTVPFTEQYAREKVPQELWSSPVFKRVNRRLTAMWGGVFAAMVPFHVVAGIIEKRPANIALNWVVPIMLVLWAVKQTTVISQSEER